MKKYLCLIKRKDTVHQINIFCDVDNTRILNLDEVQYALKQFGLSSIVKSEYQGREEIYTFISCELNVREIYLKKDLCKIITREFLNEDKELICELLDRFLGEGFGTTWHTLTEFISETSEFYNLDVKKVKNIDEWIEENAISATMLDPDRQLELTFYIISQ